MFDLGKKYEKGLVSIVSPVYNGETYLHWFLDSVLKQKYENYELIMINDGSTDSTKEILMRYAEIFRKKGRKFLYLEQENKGAAAALNCGLKNVSGEFLCWPDSDDILSENYILSLKNALDENPQCDIALATKTYSVFSDNLTKVHYSFQRSFPDGDLFYDFVVRNNIGYALGKFLVVTDKFFKALNGKEIYESRGGQNWQMMLPILYKSKHVFVDEYLYVVAERQNSHSRTNKSLSARDALTAEYRRILENVFADILSDADKERYNDILEQKYAKEYLFNAFYCADRKAFNDRLRKALRFTRGFAEKKEIAAMTLQMNSVLFGFIYSQYRKARKIDD